MRSGSNEVFLRTSFQYSKANLRKKLVSYFSDQELRIYHLKALRALVINDTSRSLAVDFSRLTSLESIIGTLPPKAAEIGSLINLKKLLIWDYKPKGKNLKDLKALYSVTLCER